MLEGDTCHGKNQSEGDYEDWGWVIIVNSVARDVSLRRHWHREAKQVRDLAI